VGTVLGRPGGHVAGPSQRACGIGRHRHLTYAPAAIAAVLWSPCQSRHPRFAALPDAHWSIGDRATAVLEPAPLAPIDTIYRKAQILVRGVRVGTTTITASARLHDGSGTVIVMRIALLAERDTIVVGALVYIAVSAVTADGTPLGELPLTYAADSAVVSAGYGGGSLVAVYGVAPGIGPVTVRVRRTSTTHALVVVRKR
jgi:hypothetical protein